MIDMIQGDTFAHWLASLMIAIALVGGFLQWRAWSHAYAEEDEHASDNS